MGMSLPSAPVRTYITMYDVCILCIVKSSRSALVRMHTTLVCILLVIRGGVHASPHQRTRSSRWTHGVEEQSHPYSPDQLNELVIDWISPSNRQLVSAHSLFLSSVAMKISIAATILALGVASAFVVDNSCHHSSVKRRIPGRAPQSFALEMSATPPSPDGKPKKKLSVAGIMAGGSKGDEPEYPKLFEDDLLDDMQKCLQQLDRRVKEGPGSLSSEELLEFEAAMDRIVADMDVKLQQGASPRASSSSGATAARSVVESAPAPPAAPAAGDATLDPSIPLEADLQQDGSSSPSGKVEDNSEEDRPEYDGEGGLGLAKGTANTYIIPGMEEMSGEEYRTALQRTVSDRQEERRKSRGGMVGNRAAHDYLSQIGYGGASNSLAANPETSSDSTASNDDSSRKSYSPFNGPASSSSSPSPSGAARRPISAPIDAKPDPVINHGSSPGQTSIGEENSGKFEDVSENDGPAYDGKGGLGLATGTRNTYIIPGMDEMSGEEYRAALQKTVSDRQEERRQSRQGVVGNRAAHNYLSDLGYGGASSGLAASPDQEDGPGQGEE